MQRTLMKKLKALGIRVDRPDADTAILRNVPAKAGFFSKTSTNLLVKRPRRGMPFFVCVDEDLEYTGANPTLAATFRRGMKREGWRVLYVQPASRGDLQTAVGDALSALGTEGAEPALAAGPANPRAGDENDQGMLCPGQVGLTDLARQDALEPTVGRSDEIDEAASCVLRWGPRRLALVAGPSGVGKTNLLHGVARRLLQRHGDLNVLLLDAAEAVAGLLFEGEREGALARLLAKAAEEPNLVIAAEHLDVALLAGNGTLLLSGFLDRGGRIIGTVLPRQVRLFDRQPLAGRVQVIELCEPTAAETADILVALRERIVAHHRIEIDDSCIRACIAAAQPLAGSMPRKALALLDAAAARSALAGAEVIAADDVYFAARRLTASAGDDES